MKLLDGVRSASKPAVLPSLPSPPPPPRQFSDGDVKILSGVDEGAFAWLTLNYLLGRLGGSEQDTGAPPGGGAAASLAGGWPACCVFPLGRLGGSEQDKSGRGGAGRRADVSPWPAGRQRAGHGWGQAWHGSSGVGGAGGAGGLPACPCASSRLPLAKLPVARVPRRPPPSLLRRRSLCPAVASIDLGGGSVQEAYAMTDAEASAWGFGGAGSLAGQRGPEGVGRLLGGPWGWSLGVILGRAGVLVGVCSSCRGGSPQLPFPTPALPAAGCCGPRQAVPHRASWRRPQLPRLRIQVGRWRRH